MQTADFTVTYKGVTYTFVAATLWKNGWKCTVSENFSLSVVTPWPKAAYPYDALRMRESGVSGLGKRSRFKTPQAAALAAIKQWAAK